MEQVIDTSTDTNVQDLSFEDSFFQAKEIFESITKDHSRKDVLKNELTIISEFIQMMIDDPDMLEKKDSIKQFFIVHMARGILEIIRNTYTTDESYLKIIAVVYKQLTLFLARNIESRKLINSMKNLFCFKC